MRPILLFVPMKLQNIKYIILSTSQVKISVVCFNSLFLRKGIFAFILKMTKVTTFYKRDQRSSRWIFRKGFCYFQLFLILIQNS